MNMNMIIIKINGVEYALKGNENEEYLHKVARYVDKKIKLIMDANKKLSTASASILTAINIVDDMFKNQNAISEMEIRVERALENESKLLEEVNELKSQLKALEEINAELDKKSNNSTSDSADSYIMQENMRKSIDSENYLKSENKELKYQLQNAKNKIIYLQNKVLESQIDVAKVKNLYGNKKSLK